MSRGDENNSANGPVMRRSLDTLYSAAAYLAALFLIGTLAMVLLGICGRLFAFQVRGTDAYAGYFMAGSGFLALAHTLSRGEHIRVNLFLEHASTRVRRALESWALAPASARSIGFAYFSVRLAWQSVALPAIATGHGATPPWSPQ